MKFTEEEMKLLDRHYSKINIFGKVFLSWNTSPRAVLRHLHELKAKSLMQSDVSDSFPTNDDILKKACVLPGTKFEDMHKLDQAFISGAKWMMEELKKRGIKKADKFIDINSNNKEF